MCEKLSSRCQLWHFSGRRGGMEKVKTTILFHHYCHVIFRYNFRLLHWCVKTSGMDISQLSSKLLNWTHTRSTGEQIGLYLTYDGRLFLELINEAPVCGRQSFPYDVISFWVYQLVICSQLQVLCARVVQLWAEALSFSPHSITRAIELVIK